MAFDFDNERNKINEYREKMRKQINRNIRFAWSWVAYSVIFTSLNAYLWIAYGEAINFVAAILIAGVGVFQAWMLNKYYKMRWFNFGSNGRRETNR